MAFLFARDFTLDGTNWTGFPFIINIAIVLFPHRTSQNKVKPFLGFRLENFKYLKVYRLYRLPYVVSIDFWQYKVEVEIYVNIFIRLSHDWAKLK